MRRNGRVCGLRVVELVRLSSLVYVMLYLWVKWLFMTEVDM